jgi:hypothetical protein
MPPRDTCVNGVGEGGSRGNRPGKWPFSVEAVTVSAMRRRVRGWGWLLTPIGLGGVAMYVVPGPPWGVGWLDGVLYLVAAGLFLAAWIGYRRTSR